MTQDSKVSRDLPSVGQLDAGKASRQEGKTEVPHPLPIISGYIASAEVLLTAVWDTTLGREFLGRDSQTQM